MSKFNLKNVNFTEHTINGRKKGSALGSQYLHKHALQLANDYHHDDFINFGYKKLDAKQSMMCLSMINMTQEECYYENDVFLSK